MRKRISWDYIMMTSSNGNIFCVTGRHLCREFTGHRWTPRTQASDSELWCFLWFAPEWRLSKQSIGWWFETPSCPSWRHSNVISKVAHEALNKPGMTDSWAPHPLKRNSSGGRLPVSLNIISYPSLLQPVTSVTIKVKICSIWSDRENTKLKVRLCFYWFIFHAAPAVPANRLEATWATSLEFYDRILKI